jgi:hypothetical protein
LLIFDLLILTAGASRFQRQINKSKIKNELETKMKSVAALLVVLVFSLGAVAQTAPAAAAPAAQSAAAPPPMDPKNPVTSVVKNMFESRARFILAAADLMPTDKWTYKPTEGQETFAAVMAHVATSNGFLCSRIGDSTVPETVSSAKAGDGKEKITAAVKASFDFCRDALGKTDDSKLGQEVAWRQNAKMPRARPVIELPVDLFDHYAAIAGYLRLNGLTPPSAQQQQRPAAPTK